MVTTNAYPTRRQRSFRTRLAQYACATVSRAGSCGSLDAIQLSTRTITREGRPNVSHAVLTKARRVDAQHTRDYDKRTNLKHCLQNAEAQPTGVRGEDVRAPEYSRRCVGGAARNRHDG